MSTTMIRPKPVAADPGDTARQTSLARTQHRVWARDAAGPAESRRAGALLMVAAAGLVPWTVALWSRLPAEGASPTWRLLWVAIDTLEAVGLFGSGVLVRRGSRWQPVPLALTGTLLLVDAGLDLVTSAPAERGWAVALLAIELPLAAWCLRRVSRPGVAAGAAAHR